MNSELTDDERLGRLEGIQQHLQLLENVGYGFLQLPNVFDADPAAKEPFVLSNSFIPERIGGSVRIVNEQDGDREPLATENLNQMLGSFLPGGFKQRWKRFDLWKGNWEHVLERSGTADIGPMFEFEEALPLGELLGEDASEYTALDLDVEDVTVYVPNVLYVERLEKNVEYYWSVDYETITAGGEPPGRYLSLGLSDPTTNYLWFRHRRDERSGDSQRLPGGNEVVTAYSFDDEVEFLRCYYTSLLTLYEKENNETLSRTLDYVNQSEDSRAFVASSERSQLLQFDIDRQVSRERIETVLRERQPLRRDLQFSKLRRDVWDELFFDRGILKNVFEVGPFVDHLLAVDHQCRTKDRIDATNVFEAEFETILAQLEQLLAPADGSGGGPLPLMGYESAPNSDILEYVRENQTVIESILDGCSYHGAAAEIGTTADTLLDFAEEVLVHSIEHGLSMWTTDESVAGGSFELWYDVTFQGRDDTTAEIGIYDSIQGGAGVATEVSEHLSESDDISLDAGLADQSACHTATTDRTVVDLLAGAAGETLYELFYEAGRIRQHESLTEDELPPTDELAGFQARLIDALETNIGDDTGIYNHVDLVSHTENRIQSLFETREIARFNAYVASEHRDVEERIDRTPRAIDLLLHLHQHLFTDPRVRETYRQFADDRKGRDLSELGERLEELTLQCIGACPDCLETDHNSCVHGMKYQTELLDRRLLAEVCSDDS